MWRPVADRGITSTLRFTGSRAGRRLRNAGRTGLGEDAEWSGPAAPRVRSEGGQDLHAPGDRELSRPGAPALPEPSPCLLPLHAVQMLPGASPLPASSSCSAAVAGSLPPACFLFMQCSCCRESPPCLLPLRAVQLLPGASPLPAPSSCSAAVARSLPPACFLFMPDWPEPALQ